VACSCIDRIEAELQADTGDDDAFIGNIIYDFEKAIRRFYLAAFFRRKRKGRFNKNYSSAQIKPEYCPFCGTKYLEEDYNG